MTQQEFQDWMTHQVDIMQREIFRIRDTQDNRLRVASIIRETEDINLVMQILNIHETADGLVIKVR